LVLVANVVQLFEIVAPSTGFFAFNSAPQRHIDLELAMRTTGNCGQSFCKAVRDASNGAAVRGPRAIIGK
jgi:hypothetical protein